ncbi:MAG: lactonase family protein [Calditrichaeota bacterium]|nr:lactonase family protein [Calditrichota bacterium]
MIKSENGRLLFVGSYTENSDQGIEIYQVDESGRLTLKSVQKNIDNPSYITISPDKKYLYAANELMNYTDKNGGYISSYSINQETGGLTFINKIFSEGGAPCYITTSNDGQFLLVSNYMQETVASFLVNNGKIEKAVSVIKHNGQGPNTNRQDASHMHSIRLDKKNNIAFAADLGADKVYVYDFDKENGELSEKENSISLAAGAGPRHFEFSKDGKTIYILNELNSTIEIFKINKENGNRNHIQTISTLPKDYSNKNYPADIHISPSGEYLYTSNRGHNSIAIFEIRKDDTLKMLGTNAVHGDWPRNFMIDPLGKYLLVANQKSKNIVTFSIEKNGGLTKIQSTTTIASPVCLQVLNADNK